MQKQYIFRYQVEGITHTPWLPSYIVLAENMREAKRKVKQDQERHALAKYSEKRKVTPLFGSRYYNPGALADWSGLKSGRTYTANSKLEDYFPIMEEEDVVAVKEKQLTRDWFYSR